MSYAQLVKWLEDNQMSCQIKEMTGHECMGCGLQRSILLLLKGEFWASIQMYPALLPLISLFVALGFYLKTDWKYGSIFLSSATSHLNISSKTL